MMTNEDLVNVSEDPHNRPRDRTKLSTSLDIEADE